MSNKIEITLFDDNKNIVDKGLVDIDILQSSFDTLELSASDDEIIFENQFMEMLARLIKKYK